jgi:hypothetical protein
MPGLCAPWDVQILGLQRTYHAVDCNPQQYKDLGKGFPASADSRQPDLENHVRRTAKRHGDSSLAEGKPKEPIRNGNAQPARPRLEGGYGRQPCR